MSHPIHFAPLQGYTEAPYRRIHQEVCGGIESYYTPFIRLEHGQIRRKDLREALPEQNQGVPVVPQVIASGIEEFVPLVEQLAQLGHRRIDINMGCPFPLQTRLGRGSGLLPHVDRVEAILQETRRFSEEQGIAFSVKMRLGQESVDECMTLLPMLNATPLVHVTMHPRVGKAQYKGELDMEAFDCFYAQCEHPIVFNGAITTVDNMQSLEQRYPRLAGLMVGRGLLARPTMAMEYQRGRMLSEAEVRQLVLEMHRRLLAHYEQAIEGGEAQLLLKMQSFWEYLEPLFGHKVIKQLLKSGNMRRYQEAVANAAAVR